MQYSFYGKDGLIAKVEADTLEKAEDKAKLKVGGDITYTVGALVADVPVKRTHKKKQQRSDAGQEHKKREPMPRNQHYFIFSKGELSGMLSKDEALKDIDGKFANGDVRAIAGREVKFARPVKLIAG